MDNVQSGKLTSITALFPEILALIFEHLDICDKGRAAQVCRTWRYAAYNRRVWRGVEAKLHLRHTPPSLYPSLVKRGITRLQVLSVNLFAKRNHLGEVIAGIENIESLNLSGCFSINDTLLERALCIELPSLKVLNLSLCKQIRDVSIMRVVRCAPNLRRLDLAGCSHVTKEGLLEIARQLKQLEELSLRSCQLVTDRAVGYLCGQYALCAEGVCGARRLRRLSLQDCQELSDSALKHVLEGLPQLRALNLSFCASITDTGLRFLAQLPSLRELNVSSCGNVSDIGVGYLSERCARLERLDASFCARVTDQALVHMSQGLYALRFLSVRACCVTDDGLSKLVLAVPDLEVLHVGQCPGVTDATLLLAAKHLSRLRSLDVYGCPGVTGCGLEALRHLSCLNTALWHTL